MSEPFYMSKDPTEERKKMKVITPKDKENFQQQKKKEEYNIALNSGEIAKMRSKKRSQKVLDKTIAQRKEEYNKLMSEIDLEMDKGGKRTRRKRKRRRKSTKKKRKRKKTKKKRRKRRKRTKKYKY